MGVDIYGRKPITKSEKPEQIDYQTSTDEQKQAYWAKVEDWEDENPAFTFVLIGGDGDQFV